jgi:SAM-dependent methyltransferase
MQRDDAYLELVRAEAAFWDVAGTVVDDELPWGFQEYQNKRLSGDPSRRWYETIPDFGCFKRGLVIGAGPGNLETHLLDRLPDLHLTVCDISKDSLDRQRERLEPAYPDRIAFQEDDLNFITLPEKTYDAIIALSAIHHVVNLEHVAYQINQSLSDGGMFFMMETVGESYYQFSDDKKRLFEAWLATTLTGPKQQLRWPDRDNWEFSPFECVRSGEVLDVFREYLEEVQVRTSNALLEPMIFVSAPGEGKGLRARVAGAVQRRLIRLAVRLFGPGMIRSERGDAEGRLLFELDSRLCDSGALQPGIAYGVYRKRA